MTEASVEPFVRTHLGGLIALVAEGLSNSEIASRLYLVESTVKWHIRKILRALGVANRAQAVARYLSASSH